MKEHNTHALDFRYRLAIPFIGKDVSAERSEFVMVQGACGGRWLQACSGLASSYNLALLNWSPSLGFVRWPRTAVQFRLGPRWYQSSSDYRTVVAPRPRC